MYINVVCSVWRKKYIYYYTFLNAYGAFFSTYAWGDIACTLTDQYDPESPTGKIVIGCDSAHVDHSDNYDIWEYSKHSAILVWFKVFEKVEEKARIQLVFTLQSHDKAIDDTKVQIFVGWLNTLEGNEKYAPDYAYPIVNGIQEVTFFFERPATGVPVYIIVRPITKHAVALWNVRGFIWE